MKAEQMTLEQAKTVLPTSGILSQLGFDIHVSVLIYLERQTSKTTYECAHLPFCSTHLAYHKPYLRVRAILLHSSDTCPASVGFLQR